MQQITTFARGSLFIKLLVLCYQNIFSSPVITNASLTLVQTMLTSNLKQRSAQFRVPAEYFDPLTCTISSNLTVKSLKSSQQKCENFLAFQNNLELLTKRL